MSNYQWSGNDALSYILPAREMDILRTLYLTLDGVAHGLSYSPDSMYIPMRLSRNSLAQIFEAYARELGRVLDVIDLRGYLPNDQKTNG